MSISLKALICSIVSIALTQAASAQHPAPAESRDYALAVRLASPAGQNPLLAPIDRGPIYAISPSITLALPVAAGQPAAGLDDPTCPAHVGALSPSGDSPTDGGMIPVAGSGEPEPAPLGPPVGFTASQGAHGPIEQSGPSGKAAAQELPVSAPGDWKLADWLILREQAMPDMDAEESVNRGAMDWDTGATAPLLPPLGRGERVAYEGQADEFRERENVAPLEPIETVGSDIGLADDLLLALRDGDSGLPPQPSPGGHLAKPTGWAREKLWPTERLEPAAPAGPDTGIEHAFLWAIMDGEKARFHSQASDKTGNGDTGPADSSLLAQNDGDTGLQRPPEPRTHSAKPTGLPGEELWPTERLDPAATLGSDTGMEHAYLWGIIDPEKARSLTRVTLKAETGGMGPGLADASLLAQNDGYTGLQRPPEPQTHSAKPTGLPGEELWPTERLEPAATLGSDTGMEHAYLWGIIDPEKARSLTRVTLKAETGG
ncbi:MAG: hypothetical protein LBF58_10135, partial [Deltaproteobacteria bacterium]|nr:hypothetical protein [Deltaproteobacteria bacterium]